MGFITFKNRRAEKPIPKKKTDDKTPVKKADKKTDDKTPVKKADKNAAKPKK